MITKRLMKVARFLRAMDPKQFVLHTFVEQYNQSTNCGTVCCAIG